MTEPQSASRVVDTGMILEPIIILSHDGFAIQLNRKWILVFDNVKSDLNFGNIIPEVVSWGKLLLSSRTKDISLGDKAVDGRLVLLPMP